MEYNEVIEELSIRIKVLEMELVHLTKDNETLRYLIKKQKDNSIENEYFGSFLKKR